MMDNIEYRQERLKDIVKKEVEEGSKEQQQDDVRQWDMVSKIKLVNKTICIKMWNLNGDNTGMIMANCNPQFEMKIKVIHSLKLEIH